MVRSQKPHSTARKRRYSFMTRRKSLLFVGCVLIVLSGFFLFTKQLPFVRPSSTPSSKGINATVAIQVSPTGSSVPGDFIGFSIELAQVCEIVRLDEQKRGYYEQLYRNLGSGVLHIGGHTSDLGVWVPDGVASCSSGRILVTRSLVNALFAFARKIGWKVTWGLNLIADDPAAAADEAAYVASTAGSNLIGFTLGNEPDLYVKHGYRPSKWNDTDYLAEWERYRGAVLRVAPSAHFVGPDACCQSPLLPSFLDKEGKYVILASHHYYVTSLHTRLTTPSALLGRDVAQQFITLSTGWVALAQEAGLPFEISETNTVAGGGVDGISNSFAAALWASDLLFQAQALHVRRVDFQNSPLAVYNVIDDNGVPQPLYYGLLFFHAVTEETRVVQAAIQSSLNITAYAFMGTDGTLHLALLNKESQRAATVRIDVEHLYHAATMIQLTAPGLGASIAIALGKRAVSTQGTWAPASPVALTLHGTEVDVQIPAGSAASIDFFE